MKQFLSIVVVCTLLCACQKNDNSAPDPSKVTISIQSPAAGQLYRSGDSIRITATVTYPSELHGYEVKVTDSATGLILYDDAEHVHDNHFSIQDIWVNTGTKSSVMKLELIADLDHNGTIAEQSFNFNYQP